MFLIMLFSDSAVTRGGGGYLYIRVPPDEFLSRIEIQSIWKEIRRAERGYMCKQAALN